MNETYELLLEQPQLNANDACYYEIYPNDKVTEEELDPYN